jgi:hypothetical protein
MASDSKFETGNWKLETGNWKLDVREAPIGNRKLAIYTPANGREDGRKKKNSLQSL